jgi:hypothetical protein
MFESIHAFTLVLLVVVWLKKQKYKSLKPPQTLSPIPPFLIFSFVPAAPTPFLFLLNLSRGPVFPPAQFLAGPPSLLSLLFFFLSFLSGLFRHPPAHSSIPAQLSHGLSLFPLPLSH